jgi:hypothetical protein
MNQEIKLELQFKIFKLRDKWQNTLQRTTKKGDILKQNPQRYIILKSEANQL